MKLELIRDFLESREIPTRLLGRGEPVVLMVGADPEIWFFYRTTGSRVTYTIKAMSHLREIAKDVPWVVEYVETMTLRYYFYELAHPDSLMLIEQGVSSHRGKSRDDLLSLRTQWEDL